MEAGRIYGDYDMAKLFNVGNGEIVWRYMDLPKFLSLLTDSSLYFTRSDQFPDELEGAMTELSKMIMEEEQRVSKFQYEIRNLYSGNPEQHSQHLRERTYISCWNLSPYESNSMWQSYAKGEYGIAIKTTAGNLRNCYKVEKSAIQHARVLYINQKKDATPRTLPHYQFLKKSATYRTEEEFRAIYMELGSPKIDLEEEKRNNHGLNIPVDLAVLIDEVYVHHKCSAWHENTLRKLMNDYGLTQIPIYRSEIKEK